MKNGSPLYNRPKATMRTTKSHHAAIKNKLRDGLHRAALFTFYFSLFVPDRENFSLFTFHSSLPQDSLFVPDRTHFSLCTIHFSLSQA